MSRTLVEPSSGDTPPSDALAAGSPPPMVDERANRLLPLDFLVIGAQKSATTFVQRCLSAHPEVTMPRAEAPHFEDPEYGPDSMAAIAAMFARVPSGVRRGIKRPDYLGMAEVPARIARHAPDARLIVVLRDPISRAVSAYRHYVTTGRVGMTDIDAAFRGLLDGTMTDDYPDAREILDWGLYGEHLERYQGFFDENRMHVALHDQVASDPVRVLAEMADFLGVDPSFTPPYPYVHRNVGPQSMAHLRFRQTRFRVRRRYIEDRAAGRSWRTLRAWPYMAALTAVDRYVLPRAPERLALPSATTIAALRDYYRADTEHAEQILHRDLSQWTRT